MLTKLVEKETQRLRFAISIGGRSMNPLSIQKRMWDGWEE
jgi:hypothetical protein